MISMLKVAFLCLCCLFHSAFAADVMLEQKAWGDFKQQFVSSDGRVIDSTNKGISHSEGQGYGLLFAVYFNDRETFAKYGIGARQICKLVMTTCYLGNI